MDFLYCESMPYSKSTSMKWHVLPPQPAHNVSPLGMYCHPQPAHNVSPLKGT